MQSAGTNHCSSPDVHSWSWESTFSHLLVPILPLRLHWHYCGAESDVVCRLLEVKLFTMRYWGKKQRCFFLASQGLMGVFLYNSHLHVQSVCQFLYSSLCIKDASHGYCGGQGHYASLLPLRLTFDLGWPSGTPYLKHWFLDNENTIPGYLLDYTSCWECGKCCSPVSAQQMQVCVVLSKMSSDRHPNPVSSRGLGGFWSGWVLVWVGSSHRLPFTSPHLQ